MITKIKTKTGKGEHLQGREGKAADTLQKKNHAVVIIGSTTIDTNIINDQKIVKIGGVTTYAGLTFRKLGVQTTIISNISLADNFIREHFLKNDIEFIAGKSDYTTRFINKYESGARIQNISSIASPIKKRQIETINQVRLIYLGPLHANDIHHNLLKKLCTLNSIITLDIQGFVRTYYMNLNS